MLLFSSAKPKLVFKKLSEFTDGLHFSEYLCLVTSWFTDEWGYIHDKGKTRDEAITDRKVYLAENADKIHLAFYGDFIVGAFRIGYKEFDDSLLLSQSRTGRPELKTSEIWFIYVDPTYRGLGAGRQMVVEIKRLSKEELGASLILLDTLKPGLNHLYMTEGAKSICESRIDCEPTDVLSIKL